MGYNHVRTLITVTYLQMTARDELTDETLAKPYALTCAARPVAAFSRFLYTSVGADWTWYMRRGWTQKQWERHVERPTLETWVAYLDGTPCGYFELERHTDASVEIALFGLLPGFIGEGLGKGLLQDALTRAWETANRVWLHTCSLDHPQALPNYLARGMRVYRKEQVWDDLPDEPLPPW